MKVKDLIKQLKKMDEEALVVVQEYNGSSDVCRPVITVKATTKTDNPKLARKHNFVWLSGFDV